MTRSRSLAVLAVVTACAGRLPAPGPGGGQVAVVVDAAPAPAAVDAAPALALTCVAGATHADFNGYDQTATLTGDNGTFTDACDRRGALTSYQCGFDDVACPGGGGHERHMTRPCRVQTGKVEPEQVDCDGQCHAGACAMRCPRAGDRLTYVSLDARGDATFDSDSDRRRIACDLAFDQRADTFDCARDPKVGDLFEVAGLGMSTSTCTGGVWGAISDARCSYASCHYVY